jgi:hypothetical protein
MHFEENQLSPRSIGISPLPTVPPSILQHTPVRSSTRCYPRFDLTMGRSRGFGSNPRYHHVHQKDGQRPVRTRFRSASGGAPLKRQRRLTRRLILQKARHHTATPRKTRHRALTACRRRGFRCSFTPLPGCFSPFPHGTRSLSVAKGI